MTMLNVSLALPPCNVSKFEKLSVLLPTSNFKLPTSNFQVLFKSAPVNVSLPALPMRVLMLRNVPLKAASVKLKPSVPVAVSVMLRAVADVL